MRPAPRIVLRPPKLGNSLAFFGLGAAFLVFATISAIGQSGAIFFVGPAAAAAFVAAIAWRQWERTYRLRLLPDGIRITEWGKSRTIREPEIVNPHRLGDDPLELKSNGQTEQLSLINFDRREKAILIEHLSQFLTTEQQAQCGDRWARIYAKLITAQKPVDRLPHYLDLWKFLCQMSASLILLSPLLILVAQMHCPDGVSPAEIPELRQLFYWELWLSGSILLIVPTLVAVLAGLGYAIWWLHQQLKGPFANAFLESRWTLSRIQRRLNGI